jgi:hypothetical protein
MPNVSSRRICRSLDVTRSTVTPVKRLEVRTRREPLGSLPVDRIRRLIVTHSIFGDPVRGPCFAVETPSLRPRTRTRIPGCAISAGVKPHPRPQGRVPVVRFHNGPILPRRRVWGARGIPAEPEVRHPSHARTEWHQRMLFSQSQERRHVAEQFQGLRRGQAARPPSDRPPQ